MSTNAGGVAVLRYGPMRDLVLGIEAVLPNGEVFHGLKRLRKDNTGYDLKQLLIGAEGTLGVVTAASLKLFRCWPRARWPSSGWRAPPRPWPCSRRAKDESGGQVESFELIGRIGIDFALKTIAGTREPLEGPPSLVRADRSGPRASPARPRRRWSGCWRPRSTRA